MGNIIADHGPFPCQFAYPRHEFLLRRRCLAGFLVYRMTAHNGVILLQFQPAGRISFVFRRIIEMRAFAAFHFDIIATATLFRHNVQSLPAEVPDD